MTLLFRSLYLPNPRLSVTNLVNFALPPIASGTAYTIPPGHNFFSRDANHADIDILRTVRVPPPSLIGRLVLESRQQWLDGAESINLPGSPDLFPLWALDLWTEYQVVVKPNIDAWAEGINWLQREELAGNAKEVKETLRILSRLAWSGYIPYWTSTSPIQSLGNPAISLAKFLSRDWFSSVQIDEMTDLILCDMQEAEPTRVAHVRLMDTIKTTEIMKQYVRSKSEDTNDYDPTVDKFLQRFGSGLADGVELLGIFHIHDDHWVATTVDVLGESIGYGDPMGDGVEASNVCSALQWFAEQHKIPLNGVDTLLCTRQQDGWNCGLYAANALAHKFLPDKYPLIGSKFIDGDLGRMAMLRRLILKFHERSLPSAKALPTIITEELNEYSRIPRSRRHSRSPSPSPVTPLAVDGLSQALGHLSVSPKRPPQKRRKIKADPTVSNQAAIPIAAIFRQPGKKTVGKVAEREEALAAMPSDISDQEAGSAAGRPRSGIMDSLTVEVQSTSESTRRYRCAGPGCTKIFFPRSLPRVLKHTKRCTKLTPEQRQLASKSSADTSPGARAEELSKGLPSTELEPSVKESAADEFFGALGTKQVCERFAAELDLAIVKLFCAAGLPPRLADYPEYKEVLRLAALAGRYYVPAGRTVLMDNHIMSEQERVRGLQITFLRTQRRLSISWDGGDLKSGEYFYTFHANTPEGRSFLLEGLECTSVSHTAEWLAGSVIDVMKVVGIELFIGGSCDGTGNTRGSRGILCNTLPTFLNLSDPDHHLSLTVKDILLLPYFKSTIKILRGTVKHFNHSKQSKALLKTARLREKIGRGLETIGKTRFATLTWSAISLRRNLNPIRGLCTSGQIEIKMTLNQLISVTEGIARAIQCLEAQACNAADVYLVWLAVTAHVRAALRGSLIPESVCNEIRGIINHRWNEFFVTNPGHEVYLATFYLNPNYVNSTIFKRPNAVAPVTITIAGTQPPEVPIGVRNAKTFISVGKYLFDQGAVEVEHGIDPHLIAFKKKKKAFAAKFKAEFTAYAQGAFPFNTPLGTMRPLDWWRKLEGTEHGGILAMYSAVPHSMADERTVSVLTWMDPALRNLQKVNTVFAFAQVRGWYRDAAKQQALSDGTTKTRASARPFPEVKFYNIEREIHSVDDEEQDEAELDDNEFDSEDESEAISGTIPSAPARTDWLDLPREVLDSSGELDLESGEVDLDSLLLEDVLADAPVPVHDTPSTAPTAGYAGMEDDDSDEEMGFALGSWA
ncbi:ribonuclease H-like domain-containing protein [Mycena galericulata]|nr:ribonuclease H-like domain-containing protein [Mycena galericulata]